MSEDDPRLGVPVDVLSLPWKEGSSGVESERIFWSRQDLERTQQLSTDLHDILTCVTVQACFVGIGIAPAEEGPLRETHLLQ